MKLYFSYSSALDGEAFDIWKNQHGFSDFSLPAGRKAEARGVRLIFDFPSRFWGGRALGLEADAGSRVRGMLFEIRDEDWKIIQHKEGVVTGSSVELPIAVAADGESYSATAFVTNPARRSTEGPVSEGFLEAVRRAYRARGLGDEALRALDEAARRP